MKNKKGVPNWTPRTFLFQTCSKQIEPFNFVEPNKFEKLEKKTNNGRMEVHVPICHPPLPPKILFFYFLFFPSSSFSTTLLQVLPTGRWWWEKTQWKRKGVLLYALNYHITCCSRLHGNVTTTNMRMPCGPMPYFFFSSDHQKLTRSSKLLAMVKC